MAKFRLLHRLLLDQGLAEQQQFCEPLPVPRRWLELVHGRRYHQAFARGELSSSEQRRIGLPATAPLVQRTWLAVGGTVLTARLALRHGLACHLAGGTHHAFPSHGSGFCIFNDCAVAARVLLQEGAVQRLMVIDLDVHQGDATAAIFADEPRVFTLSAHCASNFPLHKQRSDVDIPLADGLGDDDYLVAVGDRIPELLDQVQPQLVLYNAGVDPHHGDRLGVFSHQVIQ
jgi:acetoin utilization deacetylase AcuC-like enzyme